MSLLIVCCVIIYSLVLYFLPKNYQTELESQFITDFQNLTETLESQGVENSYQTIVDFSIKNNASVNVTDENNDDVFRINTAGFAETSVSNKTLTTVSNFNYTNKSYKVESAASLAAVSQSYNVLIKLIPLIAVMIILISVVGAYICSRSFSKPLVEICGVAKRMTNLDMTWECDTSRSDEIGILAKSLNEMSSRLSDALESLQTANQQLQLDIENERRQEKQRVDFFTAVSHELKTPITIIQGELEGMIYNVGDYKNHDTYLRHSLKTAETMEKLVKEILSAAKMGAGDFELTKSDIDMSRLIKKCCHEVQGLAEDKNMIMTLNIKPDSHYYGDEKLIQKAISNIAGNAVFHSPHDAMIYVTFEDGVLTVENTGTQLCEEDTKQLFMPFYRIDKSHNRSTGGSGLGLYIVKTILDRHDLSYYIYNTKNGVCFKINFN